MQPLVRFQTREASRNLGTFGGPPASSPPRKTLKKEEKRRKDSRTIRVCRARILASPLWSRASIRMRLWRRKWSAWNALRTRRFLRWRSRCARFRRLWRRRRSKNRLMLKYRNLRSLVRSYRKKERIRLVMINLMRSARKSSWKYHHFVFQQILC